MEGEDIDMDEMSELLDSAAAFGEDDDVELMEEEAEAGQIRDRVRVRAMVGHIKGSEAPPDLRLLFFQSESCRSRFRTSPRRTMWMRRMTVVNRLPR